MSASEASNAVSVLGFAAETSPGRVATARNPACPLCTSEVIRLYKSFGTKNDHLYTMNPVEITAAVNGGYKIEQQAAFYCSSVRNNCGATVPLYRFLIGTDHFYTHYQAEGLAAGKDEGILCYIWP